jgi:5-methyltetrahydrofolate--homocysteine methyltransferase
MNKITLSEIDKKEALYYLGYRGNPADKNTEDGLKRCEEMILAEISPKYVLKIVDTDDPILIGNDIAELLENCDKAAIFCATLGAGADKIIEKSRYISPELQLISDALCNAAIEQVCDKVEEAIKAKYKGAELTMRFSPGYGDFPIEAQRAVLGELQTEKYIGVTCLDSYTMKPTKSVSAIVGIKLK